MPPPVPTYPGTILTLGSTDSTSVLLIQKRLNNVGCGPVPEDGVFNVTISEAIQHFQSKSFDIHSLPLAVDGMVGPMTWAALFVQPTPVATQAGTPLQAKTLAIAGGEVGTMESPLGSNRGPKVDQYLLYTGLNPAAGSFPWCAAFAYWCFGQAAAGLAMNNPAPRTAGVLDFWRLAGSAGLRRIVTSEATATPSLVFPGMVFLLSTGAGTGHMGLIESVQGVVLTTIEGNSNDNGSRDGIGVFRHTGRRISQISLGFVDCR